MSPVSVPDPSDKGGPRAGRRCGGEVGSPRSPRSSQSSDCPS